MKFFKYKIHFTIYLSLFFSAGMLMAQQLLQVDGNGLFTSPASTNVDIRNTDDNTNALIRFGDNSQSKVSVGFNGNEDLFKISTATTLGADDFTMTLDGKIGINTTPTDHRLLINHNSSSGTSAHLSLRENNTGDFARLRFENSSLDDIWTIAGRATDGDALLNIFYNNGTDFANIMSFDGDLFRVGIHNTNPEAYLHIKQVTNSVPALLLQNDDQTGAEKWQILVNANSDLEFQFEGVTRGLFSSATGAYTPVPPPPSAHNAKSLTEDKVLEKILKVKTYTLSDETQPNAKVILDPRQVNEVDPDWVVKSEDGRSMGINHQDFLVLAIRALQEQQEYITQQNNELSQWEKSEIEMEEKILQLERSISEIRKANNH